MTLARAFRLLLATVLLAVWQGALLHPLQHRDAHGGLVHLADVNGNQPGGHDEDGGGIQPLCDAIAAVSICIADSPIIAFVAQRGPDALRAFQRIAPQSAAPPPYRSQAPPTLL